MNKLYYDFTQPQAFSGINALHRKTNKSVKHIKKWLSSQRTYTLHKPIKRHFPTRKYYAKYPNQFWEADILSMQEYYKENDGFKYILTVIDIFSRYGYAIKLKNKTPQHVLEAFKSINHLPTYFSSDMGSEFKSVFASYLKNNNVKQFFRHPPFKAAVCERFNRTIKTKLVKYFTHVGNSRWIDILPKVIKAYNNSFHRTIQTTPTKARMEENKEMILELQKQRIVKKRVKPKFKISDYVRITKYKGTFEKGYTPSWSEEIFQIYKVDTKDFPVMYQISSLDGEIIDGKFYKEELQRVTKPENYAIEKIIKKQNGKYLVKFIGYKKPEWVETINKIKTM